MTDKPKNYTLTIEIGPKSKSSDTAAQIITAFVLLLGPVTFTTEALDSIVADIIASAFGFLALLAYASSLRSQFGHRTKRAATPEEAAEWVRAWKPEAAE